MDTDVPRHTARWTGSMMPVGRILAVAAKRALCAAVMALSLATIWSSAQATDPDKDDATRFLQEISARAETMLVDESLNSDQRQKHLEDLIGSGFDLDAMSRFVLAEHWKNATTVERAEFRNLFRDYIILTIGRHMDSIPGFDLEVIAARRLGENALAVRSNLYVGEKRSTVYIDWRLRRNAGYWRIADMVVQGISFAAVIRSEFVAVIDAHGGEVESLLVELRKRTTGYQSVSG